jgi:hypothetical protein
MLGKPTEWLHDWEEPFLQETTPMIWFKNTLLIAGVL